MSDLVPYFERLAAAYVRGELAAETVDSGERARLYGRLDDLGAQDWSRLIDIGLRHGLRLHRFKRTMGLPRVQAVLGTLKSFRPANLLDIGSGRGAFLWPLLDTFHQLPVTAVDQLDYRVQDLEAVRRGGVEQLSVALADATSLPFAAASFELVTLLEVLEHIPDAERAITEACRVAKTAVVLSVPSKPDTNPEHIHLFNEARLRELFSAAGTEKVRFTYVLNHLLAVAAKPRP